MTSLDDELWAPPQEFYDLALLPTDLPYPSPLDQLLLVGEFWGPNEELSARYRELGITQDHVAELARMARDRTLYLGNWNIGVNPGVADLESTLSALDDADDDEVATWAPFHAMSALSDLDFSAQLPDVVRLFDVDDDWLTDNLPTLFAKVGAGPGAVAIFAEYLSDQRRWQYGRMSAAESLKQIAERDPTTRDAVVAALCAELRLADSNPPTLNAAIIGRLANLHVSDALPLVRHAFEIDRVDEFLYGGWSEVLALFDVEPNPDDPLVQRSRERSAAQQASMIGGRLATSKLGQPKKKKNAKKQKRKTAAASRKHNKKRR